MPGQADWKEFRGKLLEHCPVALYDAEKRACSRCAANKVCAQTSIYFMQKVLEPAVRSKVYPGTWTLDEAVQTIHIQRLHEKLDKNREYTKEELMEILKTHDEVLIDMVIEHHLKKEVQV